MTAYRLMMLLALPVAFCFASCHAEEQEEQNEITDNRSVDTGRVKAVDYIPLNTNESSIGDTKRKRKFYIR